MANVKGLQNPSPEAAHRLSRPHGGRLDQVGIFLGKQLRMFIYQNDWKVLPMSALVAGLVTLVTRRSMFVNMEGTLRGAFALTCVAIWNGCFNSIQSVCRERDIVKREHRSGMHISSYITAHALYQALLCLVQTILTVYICVFMRVRFPSEGIYTPWMVADIGISLFLITFAADMLSLLISCLCHSTTAAMTVMPFILIFQLVFSGGFFTLPDSLLPLTDYTVSSSGLKVIAAQADYNRLPMSIGWTTLSKMKNEEVTFKITVGQILDLLSDESNESVAEFRATPVTEPLTAGDLIDQLAADPEVVEKRDETLTYTTTVGDLINMYGEQNLRSMIEERTAAASAVAEYEKEPGLILGYWLDLIVFALVYFGLSVLVMEFIDKDHR